MTNLISVMIQQSSGRVAQAAQYARTGWTLANAVVAIVAGISTLNLAVAHIGVATLNDVASPFVQQLVRVGRQA
jgi:hypothetical protein